MKRKNRILGLRIIASLIIAVCGILSVASAQTISKADNGESVIAAPREVRIVTQNATAGQTITVVIQADTAGDEAVYGFSLNYNTAVLTYVPNSLAIGSGATRQSGGLCNLLTNTNTAGQFGYSIDCGGSTITAGNNKQLVTMQFVVASNAALGSTPLTFGDVPTRRVVSSTAATSLPTTFTDGNVTIVSSSGPTRIVRVLSQNSTRGATITVVLEADAAGDESVYGFSLNYNTAVLTYVPNSLAIGSGATSQSGGLCNLLTNPNTAGQFGYSIDCNTTITPGNNKRFVTMQFVVASNAALGSTPLTFGSVPTRRVVSSTAATSLPTTFSDGFVNISTTTAASVEISGKVSLPRGRGISNAIVQLIGGNETLTTRTNAFGFYRLQVRAGETFVINVSHKRYNFASRVVSIVEATNNLDFTSEP